MFAKLKAFFAAAPDTFRGFLNVAEIKRVALTALLSGATAGGVLYTLATTPTIHADPELGSAIVALVVAAVDVYRRLQHSSFGEAK